MTEMTQRTEMAEMTETMDIERVLRLMAGSVVLLSLALSVLHSQSWLFLTAFAGANMLQSAFTNWCPAVWMLKRLGLRRCCERVESTAQ